MWPVGWIKWLNNSAFIMLTVPFYTAIYHVDTLMKLIQIMLKMILLLAKDTRAEGVVL